MDGCVVPDYSCLSLRAALFAQQNPPRPATIAQATTGATRQDGFFPIYFDDRSGKLQLVFESPGPEELDFPDNVTVSNRGTLVLCEDSSGDNFLRGMNGGGQIFEIALNRLRNNATGAPRFGEEFAGATFSPDGHTMFVNIQASAGITFAIWGPWTTLGV